MMVGYLVGNALIAEVEAEGDALVDQMLHGLFAVSCPLVVLSFLRVFEQGWLPVMAVHAGLLLFLGAVLLLRGRLTVALKGSALIFIFAAIGVGAVFNNSALVHGTPYFVLSFLVAAIFFQRRVTCAAACALFAFGLLHEWWIHGGVAIGGLLLLLALCGFSILLIHTLSSLRAALASTHALLREQNTRLLEAHERLQASSKAKSDFLANMSHELRTPMTGILGSADLLRERELDREELRYVDMIRSSGGALLGLLNDILDLSKIEANKLQIDMLSLSLPEVVDDVVTMMRACAEAKGLAVEIEQPADLPGVKGDPLRLRQVLLNLVGNAIKFTDRGAVVVRVEVVDRSDDDLTLCFTVCDSGIGVRPEDLQRLFRSFQQLDTSTTRRFGGTGLGLAICKRLVHLMGGEIGVDSEFGVGSQFWFTLRMPLGDEPTPAPSAAAKTPLSRPLGLAGRLLLVDDSELNRIVLEAFLELLGFAEVDVVSGGREALTRLDQADYDLALVDIMMPDLNGTELIRKLRRGGGRNADIPVLAVTADTSVRETSLGDAGFSGVLHKPINLARLTAALREHLQEARPAEERG